MYLREDATSDAHQEVLCSLPATKRVCVVGLGYVGLPMAALIANAGFDVLGVDINPSCVDRVNLGSIHSPEPGLSELVAEGKANGKLRAALEPSTADVFLICVPTPLGSDHAPDLSYVEQACRSIRPNVRRDNLIILESTSPPGTTESCVVSTAIPKDLTVGRDVFVAYCPERVFPGNAIAEIVNNNRIAGGVTAACAQRAKAFFAAFGKGDVSTTDAVTAEVTKLVENSYRDVNIAFANEVSYVANQTGADPFEVIRLANLHPRVNVHTPGPGVGGHCIPIDPWFLVHAVPTATRLIRTARQVNDAQVERLIAQVKRLTVQQEVRTIGCLGIAYKANVDDCRESPSLRIVQKLREQTTAEVLVGDPVVEKSGFSEFHLHPLEEVLSRSDVLVLLTDHQEFRQVPVERREQKHVIDPRGAWQTANLRLRRSA